MSWLKLRRQEMGLTLEALANLVGTSKSYIWELEQPGANPGITMAYKIAKVLDRSVYAIFPDETDIAEEIHIIRRVAKKDA